jgi:hypothetical protein
VAQIRARADFAKLAAQYDSANFAFSKGDGFGQGKGVISSTAGEGQGSGITSLVALNGVGKSGQEAHQKLRKSLLHMSLWLTTLLATSSSKWPGGHDGKVPERLTALQQHSYEIGLSRHSADLSKA